MVGCQKSGHFSVMKYFGFLILTRSVTFCFPFLQSCLISNNNIGVCCSTAPVQQAPAANNNFLPPQNQQQTQQAQPTVNVPTK